MKQNTIGESVTVSGVGLHTGVDCVMTFLPAAPHTGINFVRVDLSDRPVVPALIDYVVDTSRGTTLEKEGTKVHTVEHTLAALSGLKIDNVTIELTGIEPPIMDGSSTDFVKALQKAGIVEQNALKDYFEITEAIFYTDKDNNVELIGLPLDDYRITVMVDYNSPTLGSQHAILNNIDDFPDQISDSRTFCFFHELESLYNQGLIKGGDFDNAVVIVDREIGEKDLDKIRQMFGKKDIKIEKGGTLNNVKLRHKNEPARHKLLDVVGDLTLLGKPIKGQIVAARPGHAANVAFCRKLKKELKNSKNTAPKYNPKTPPVLDINQISSILPHRFPFLLIDKIIHLDETTVTGIKNVTLNEPFFQGHFPGNPVMPGVIQIEAMAQIGGILVLNTVEDPQNYWTYFMGIEKFRFRKMVLPGDQLVMKCTLIDPIRRGIAKMNGKSWVGGKLVCEGSMVASIIRKDQ